LGGSKLPCRGQEAPQSALPAVSGKVVILSSRHRPRAVEGAGECHADREAALMPVTVRNQYTLGYYDAAPYRPGKNPLGLTVSP
jgi:hypothetical protein